MATIINLDIGKATRQQAKPKILVLGLTYFQLDYPADKKIRTVLQHDPLLQEQIKTNTHFANKSVATVWKKYASRNKQYKKYKWKEGSKVAVAAASLSASIASLAASAATFGASAIPSIIGIFKTSATLGKQIGELCLEVEDKQRELNKILLVVKQRYPDLGKPSIGKDALANLANSPFLTEFKSLKLAKDCGDAVDNKLAGVQTKGHKFAKNLDPALKKSLTLHKELTKTEKARLSRLETKVQTLIGDVRSNVRLRPRRRSTSPTGSSRP